MKFAELTALRPTDTSVAAHERALTEIHRQLAQKSDDIVRLTEARGAALLREGAEAVRAIERDIADAALDREQLGALAHAIEQDLPETRIAEKVEAWKQRHAALQAKFPEHDQLVVEEYTRLAAAMVALLKQLQAFNVEWSHYAMLWAEESAAVKGRLDLAPLRLSFWGRPGYPAIGELTNSVRLPLLRCAGSDNPLFDPDSHTWNASPRPLQL
jgi:hypothetical protein